MNKAMRFVAFVALLVFAGRPGWAQEDALTQPRPGEGRLGPYPINQAVQGVPISMRAFGFLTIKTQADAIGADVRVVADLSDLQRKVGALVDTIPLPTNNCDHFGMDNLVARIWGKQITISGEWATLKLSGDVDDWACIKNPIPCTRVEWHGIVPQVISYECNPPIKNRNVNQPFDASLPFRLRVVDSHTVAVELGTPTVNLGGALGGVTNGILKIAGVDINARAKQALEGAINPELLKKSIPQEILAFNPVITRAELLNNSGSLWATLEMNATIDAKALNSLGQVFQSAQPGR